MGRGRPYRPDAVAVWGNDAFGVRMSDGLRCSRCGTAVDRSGLAFLAMAGVGVLFLAFRGRHQAFWASIFGERQASFAASLRYVVGPGLLVVLGVVGFVTVLVRRVS
jgi:hypothetical protein